MNFYLNIDWGVFCIMFGTMLLIGFIMNLRSAYLYTLDVIVRKFSIMDLEFPATPQELVIFIRGIFRLPPELSKKSLNSLKNQLYLDFLFMPAAYGTIFILCMKVSMKMTSFGHSLFAVLAWLQLISWICNIIENIYLLKKISPEPVASTEAVHKAYLILELCKWGIPLISIVCGVAGIFYFWLIGNYSYNSLQYLVTIVSEVALFSIAKKIAAKTDKEKLKPFLESNA